MTHRSAFFLPLLALLAPLHIAASFGVEIEIHYDSDSGISLSQFTITPPTHNGNPSLSDLALYEAAIITKAIGNQIVRTTKQDPQKTALLNKQLKEIIAINSDTEAKIKNIYKFHVPPMKRTV